LTVDGCRPKKERRTRGGGRVINLPSGTKELRCGHCGKLLAEKAERGTIIICSRCKTRNERP
jgi:hypothetical protein